VEDVMAAKIIHVGDGTFVDTEEVAAPEGTSRDAYDPDVHIYAYATFRSLEHVAYGLMRTTGGPKDEEIDSVAVGQYGMEPRAPYWEFTDAMHELGHEAEGASPRVRRKSPRERRWVFEEVSLVEVRDEESYIEAIEALGLPAEDEKAWEGPGLYDFRDDPPSFRGSVEEYELDSLQDEADQAFEFMFQGDEWQDAYRELAADDEEETDR
jgi:hypothetical protein